VKIVIVGDGKVGYALSEQLSKENHDVTIIDNNEATLARTAERIDVIGIKGNGASYAVQKEAGVSEADLLIAATSTDEVNMICCLLAKKLGAKHTIARIRNPEYRDQLHLLKEDLGLSMTINPELAAANEMARLISFPSALSMGTFSKGKVELIEFRLNKNNHVVGKSLLQLKQKHALDVLICVVDRDGTAFIPNGNTVLQEGDKIHITGTHKAIVTFLRANGIIEEKIKTAMLVGGGRISYYLANIISGTGVNVKIIEKDAQRCLSLCEMLPDVKIICGDGSEQELIEAEGLTQSDAFIALTGMDEENLIVAMYAANRGVTKVMAKINRLEYLDVIKHQGIDSVISPKHITTQQILQYVRSIQDAEGGKIDTLYKIINGQVQILEFTATESLKNQGKSLSKVELIPEVLIAVIVRNGKLIIPSGQDCLYKGDSVIIVTTNEKLMELNDIFKK